MNKVYVVHRHNTRGCGSIVVDICWSRESAEIKANREANIILDRWPDETRRIDLSSPPVISRIMRSGEDLSDSVPELYAIMVVRNDGSTTTFSVEEHPLELMSALELLAGESSD